MSDTLDLTLLSGAVTEMARDLRLMRLQMDNLASRLASQDGRFGGIEGRLGALEQSFHDLANEVARGFGQMQQQLTRHEKRFDALDAGLAKLSADLVESTTAILLAVRPPGS